jgi:hypothetical protein
MKLTKRFVLALALGFSIVLSLYSNSQAEIRVYDNNNQFLGILLEASTEDLRIFIPSLNSIFSITQEVPLGGNDSIYFESTDCSGTAYAANGSFPGAELFPTILNLKMCKGGFFSADFSKRTTIQARSYFASSWEGICSCYQITPGQSYVAYPLTGEIQLPFNFPISYPIRYKYMAPNSVNKTVVVPLN